MLYLVEYSGCQFLFQYETLNGKRRNQPHLSFANIREIFWVGFGILDARSCPMEEKYLFVMSGNSEELKETLLLVGHLREVLSLRTSCFRSKNLFMPTMFS